MRNSKNINNMRKEYNERRKIDYTIRDLSHLDQSPTIVRSGGCLLKFIIFSIVIGAMGAAYFMLSKNMPLSEPNYIYKFNNGIERKLTSYDKVSGDFDNKDYYKIAISIESRRRGSLSYQNLVFTKYLQKLLKNEMKLESISIADYVEKTFLVTKESQKYSALKGTKDAIVLRIFSLLEIAGFNIEDFVSEDYSNYYIYLKDDGKRSLESMTPKILEIAKRYSKDRRLKLILDFQRGAGKIIPFNKLRDNSGTLVIDK